MVHNKKQIPLKYKIWTEGKYIDFWNIPHLLISLLLGFIFISLGLDIWASLILIIIIKMGWEIYEHNYVIKEKIPNKIFDVLTGVLAILVIYYVNRYYPIGLMGFFIILCLSIILVAWGLYSMKKLNLFIKK